MKRQRPLILWVFYFMKNLEIKKGCVYFFRHVGLTPVKIGYSENESPINRFNQFRTYAPYGSEILGFIIISDAKELETLLHRKYANKRLNGEWFDLTEQDVNNEIDFYTNVADIKDRNEFQIAWAKQIENKKNKIVEDIKTIKKPIRNIDLFKELYKTNPYLNKAEMARKFEVSRKSIHDWIKKIENK
jgi:ribonuclease HI